MSAMLLSLSFFVINLVALVRAIDPIVIYHGLNSTCCEGKTQELVDQIRDALPSIYIHSVRLGKDDTDDRLRTLVGNLDRQVDDICRILKADEKLLNGFTAIGLSQVIHRPITQKCLMVLR